MNTPFIKRADLEAIKANKSALTAIIKKVLKVDAGPQSVLDIQAVAEGFVDYNTAIGLAKKDFYIVRHNLGTKNEPFYIERELGYLNDSDEAQIVAIQVLSNCKAFMHWSVYCNDEWTGIIIETKPSPKKGFEYTIELASRTIEGIQNTLDEIKACIDREEEAQSNYDRSFRFSRAVFEHINILPSHKFAMFDSQSIIEHHEDKDGIDLLWNKRDTNSSAYDGFLILGRNVSLKEAERTPNEEYYCIDTHAQKVVMSGYYDEILKFIRTDDREFSLFKELTSN